MTAREVIELAAGRPWVMALLAALPPLLALAARAFHGRKVARNSAWKYLYTVLVYSVCAPGMLAVILTGYALFFTGESLLDVNLLVYGLPPLTMGVTLLLVSRNIRFDDVPGFDRLSGLMLMLAMTFVIVFTLARTRIWVFFGGSIALMFLLAAAVFALLKWGAHRAFREKG